MSRLINLKRVINSRTFGRMVEFEYGNAHFEDDGKAHNAPEKFTARAIVRPVGKDDLELLAEGQRHFPSMLIHIIKPLAVGDYMYHHGERWKVINAQDWSDYGFYRCIAIRSVGTETGDSDSFPVT